MFGGVFVVAIMFARVASPAWASDTPLLQIARNVGLVTAVVNKALQPTAHLSMVVTRSCLLY